MSHSHNKVLGHVAHFRDPVSGSSITMQDDCEHCRWLNSTLYELAVRHQIPIVELILMTTRLAVISACGDLAYDEKFDPQKEGKSLLSEVEFDAKLLDRNPSLTETIKLWAGMREQLVRAMELWPNQQERWDDLMARYEAGTERICERLRKQEQRDGQGAN